jgi:hypothetical protein
MCNMQVSHKIIATGVINHHTRVPIFSASPSFRIRRHD